MGIYKVLEKNVELYELIRNVSLLNIFGLWSYPPITIFNRISRISKGFS